MSTYWEVARDTGATLAMLLSTMVPYLLAQPVRAAETQHRLRLMLAAPLPADLHRFGQRFGIDEFTTAYGMTEMPAALGLKPGDRIATGSCGRPNAHYDIRLVDDDDLPVPAGAVGEAIVRTDLPWMLSPGYANNPEATASAWRNGWFHTGDLLRCDENCTYYYVDRKKDALRRRGENVSTYEVEQEVAAHPAVAEVACVAAPANDNIDDEVKVFVVPKPGHAVDLPELLRFCAARMAHFMVPRYFELVGELPKTASARVRKFELRERGNGAGTWDAEAHGWKVTRNGLIHRSNSGISAF